MDLLLGLVEQAQAFLLRRGVLGVREALGLGELVLLLIPGDLASQVLDQGLERLGIVRQRLVLGGGPRHG